MLSLSCFFTVWQDSVVARHLVVALETLVQKLKVPEDVAGASFMAFGSATLNIIVLFHFAGLRTMRTPPRRRIWEWGILGSNDGVLCDSMCVLSSATEALKLNDDLFSEILVRILLRWDVCIFGDGEIQLFPTQWSRVDHVVHHRTRCESESSTTIDYEKEKLCVRLHLWRINETVIDRSDCWKMVTMRTRTETMRRIRICDGKRQVWW